MSEESHIRHVLLYIFLRVAGKSCLDINKAKKKQCPKLTFDFKSLLSHCTICELTLPVSRDVWVLLVHREPLFLANCEAESEAQKNMRASFIVTSHYIWLLLLQHNRNPCPSDLIAELAANDFPRHMVYACVSSELSWRSLKSLFLLLAPSSLSLPPPLLCLISTNCCSVLPQWA